MWALNIFLPKGVKHIFENITSQGFLYDIDLILQSKNLNLKIKEQPVDYKFHTDSSVSGYL